MRSLVPPTTRSPRLTCVSDGNPLRRLLLTSKAFEFEVRVFDSHGPPLDKSPDAGPRQCTGRRSPAKTHRALQY